MSGKREREKGDIEGQGKAVKTHDDEEMQNVHNIVTFCSELQKQSGPQLLISIRKVGCHVFWFGLFVSFFFFFPSFLLQALNTPELFTFGEVCWLSGRSF